VDLFGLPALAITCRHGINRSHTCCSVARGSSTSVAAALQSSGTFRSHVHADHDLCSWASRIRVNGSGYVRAGIEDRRRTIWDARDFRCLG
jgi:hypothetical protein